MRLKPLVLALGFLAIHPPATLPQTGAPEYLPLAQRFAPEIRYAGDEPNLPSSVEWFLARTTLSVHSQGCAPVNVALGPASVDLLRSASYTPPCAGMAVIKASGTRSASRTRTYILADVSTADKRGSTNPADWPLYFHAFRNTQGGWSIQYWCFYPFNTGATVLGIEIGHHGGDWEMFQVNTAADGTARSVAMTGHTSIAAFPWSDVSTTGGTHPIVYVERGGHEMHLNPQGPPPYIQRGTWPGAAVTGALTPRAPSATHPAGPLVDLGTRLQPLVGCLNYSGLWGSLGQTPISSGYWGPPFNETGMPSDSFLTAWCHDMLAPQEQRQADLRECYPDDIQ